MSQVVVLNCKGLFTYPNNLSAVPVGALTDADNIYIDRNDVAQPRRGFKVFTTDALINEARSLHDYQNRLIIHDDATLQYETDPIATPGIFTLYQESVDGVLVDASVVSPDFAAGLKIKSAEVSKNLYLTSSKGIMKIDNVENSILRSGVPQALDFDLELVTQDGFLTQDNAVAYRVVWGYKDANNNLLLGTPSERQTIYYYGISQFIDDVNALLANIAAQPALFTETYPAALNPTDTLDTIYATMKSIVGALNLESLLVSKEYEAGGTIEISSITTRPKSVITANSYFIFEDNSGRFVPWMNLGGGTQPNPSLQSDLQLTDTFIEVNLAAAVQATLVNQTLTYTAVPLGIMGNDVTITLVNPGTNHTLSQVTTGNNIVVTLGYSAGAITTTRAQLVTAWTGVGFESALAKATLAGAGATLLTALAQTNLAGGTGTISSTTNASQVADALAYAISNSSAAVTLSTTDNNIILRTLYDQDIDNTIDGVTATGFTFSNIQEGSELTGASIILITLQEAFDLIVTNLNANSPTPSPVFIEARTSKAVSLYITIPSDIINLSESGTSFFYQVYRSALFELSDATVVVPDDELQQVFEAVPTPAEIAAGFVGPFTDETTEDFRAQDLPLYTNPSQEGILQSNYQPPLAKDITLYKNQLFFANTVSKYALFLSLITGQESSGPTDPGFTASAQASLVNQAVTYTAIGYGTPGNLITITLVNPGVLHTLSQITTGNSIVVTLGWAAGNVTTTGAQLATFLNANSTLVTTSSVGATPLSALGITALAGATDGTVVTFTSGADTFSLYWAPDTETDNYEYGTIALIDPTQGTGDPADDLSPGQILELMAQKIVKAVNRHMNNSFMNAFYSSGFNDVPGKINFQSRFLENPIFTITSNEQISREAFSPELESVDAVATNDVAPNRVYYSKLQQPEAVPLTNYFNVGAGDAPIIRIVASRDSLFVFKEDGIFTISGQEGETLQVNGLDNTVKIIGPETAVIGNNQIFCFAADGITRITEAGAQVISTPIEDKLLAFPDTALFANLARTAFGVFYDTEKKFYLWMPTTPEDTIATQCFVFNTTTQTWTRLPISKNCGIINSRDNKMYLGCGDILHVEQERKNFNLFDYADREYGNQIISISYDDYEEELTLKLQSVSDITVGDALQQTEYMRPYYFNRILTQLDSNPSPTIAKDYYSLLGVTTKAEILAALNNFADKLDADPGVTDTTYRANIDAIVGTTPADVLDKFNTLVSQMNLDTGIDESDFPLVEQTPTFYTFVMSINSTINTVVVQDNFDFDVGDITTFESIDTLITWAPNHAGNPAIWKHFRECNLMFSDTICRKIEIGFASDVSRNFQMEDFTDDSLAGYGIIEWGLKPWGSDPEPRPYRTYIPRVKQRSRYINAQFTHTRAFEPFLLNGLSISYDNLTERVTR